MKGPWHYLTWADWLVLSGLFAIGLVVSAWTLSSVAGQRLVVTDGQRILYLAPLDHHGEFEVQGRLGKMRLAIDEHGARVVASTCPLKICIRMGPARHVGDLLACVPNRILVQIEGRSADDAPYDLLSR